MYSSRGRGTCHLVDRTSGSTTPGSSSSSASGQTFIHNAETRLFVKSITNVPRPQTISNGGSF